MDASRNNSPSRKSRFRAQGTPSYRPSTTADEPTQDAAEEPMVYPPEEYPAEPPAAEMPPLVPPPLPTETLESNEAPAAYTAEPIAQYEEALPAGLRLTRSTDHLPQRTQRGSFWPLVLTALLCLAAGAVGGYFLRGGGASAASLAARPDAEQSTNLTLPLNPATLQQVDAAFQASKVGSYAEARQDFTRLAQERHDWPSMQIEAARTALYEHDFDGAEKILTATLRARPNVDAEFLTGLLQMTLQGFDKSEAAFGRAVALDPTRADVFYFWGECLRRQGKPQDAAEKFHQALIRNQYETTEGLYQLKLWLSEIQADQEVAKGSSAKIDADLASGHPSGQALFAAAARDLKAGNYKQAGERIGQAQKVVEPAVFRVVLQDPIFLQENYRAELAPFYR